MRWPEGWSAPNYLPRYQKFVETYAREHPLLDLKFARPSIMELWWLDRMAAAADNAPEIVHGAVADVRRSVVTVIDRLNASSQAMIEALRAERVALTADVRTEREAALIAVDEQRQALALDAARIGDQVMTTAGQEIRHLAREVVLLGILMAVILLGLPFAAGYLVGRTRRDRSI